MYFDVFEVSTTAEALKSNDLSFTTTKSTYSYLKHGAIHQVIPTIVDGKKDGKGTIHFYNGDTFVGEFRQDKKHGPGKFTYSSGETSSGIWEDDLFIGK